MSFGIQAGIPQSDINRYTVIVREGVTYIEGAAPMSHVSALLSAAPKGNFMSVRVAQLAKATIAWGSREDLDAEEARMVAESQRCTAGDSPIKQWLAHGERGSSSNAMAQALWTERPSGWIASHDPTAHPHDPDDLRRCLLLLDMVPELAPRLRMMANVSPVWAALVDNWAELCVSFFAETGAAWKTKPKDAPKTYELMTSIINGAKA